MSIHFFSEEIAFKISGKRNLKKCIKSISIAEGFDLEELNIIFCSDEYLLDINNRFLGHDYLTDIITFDNNDYLSPDLLDKFNSKINGDLYISIPRVKENAETFGFLFAKELHRIIIHGVLHLMGYKDKTINHKREMTEKEDFYLSKYSVDNLFII